MAFSLEAKKTGEKVDGLARMKFTRCCSDSHIKARIRRQFHIGQPEGKPKADINCSDRSLRHISSNSNYHSQVWKKDGMTQGQGQRITDMDSDDF